MAGQYATEADIVSTYGQRQLELVAQTASPGGINRALIDASALADSYISRRYSVPLAVPPPYLKGVVIDIALYKLAMSGMARTEEHRVRYEDAIGFLKDVAAGRADLGPVDDDGNAGTSTVSLTSGFLTVARG